MLRCVRPRPLVLRPRETACAGGEEDWAKGRTAARRPRGRVRGPSFGVGKVAGALLRRRGRGSLVGEGPGECSSYHMRCIFIFNIGPNYFRIDDPVIAI